MHRIDSATAEANTHGAGKNGFTGGTPPSIAPTDLTAKFFNAVQEEIATVVESFLGALSDVSHVQLLAALNAKYGTRNAASGFAGLDTNTHAALTATGGGATALTGTGNGTGAGLRGDGGATDGTGVAGNGGGANGIGVLGSGLGNGAGLYGTGPIVAVDAHATSNGIGVAGYGGGTGVGGLFDGYGNGAAATDDAIKAIQNVWLAGSNPVAGTGFYNRLTPMNMAKAWASITLNATTPVVASGFNVTNPRYSGNVLLVDLVTDLAGTAGAVFVTQGGIANNFVYTGDLTAAGTVQVSALTASTGVAFNISTVANAAGIINIFVFGAQ